MGLAGVKFSVRGKQNIVKDKAAVILINHQSSLDLVGKLINISYQK